MNHMGIGAPDRLMLDRALAAIERETDVRARVVDWDYPLDFEAADAVIEVYGPQGLQPFAVQIKLTARAETIQKFTARLHFTAKYPYLLVTPYMPLRVAERCRQIGLCFADTAGNMFLKAPGLYLYVVGKRPTDAWETPREGRAANPAGLRIVFAILCEPALLDAPYRQIADAAHVALGTVGPVFKDLENRRYVTNERHARRHLLNPERLLEEWVAAFPTILRPKLNPRRFRAQEPDWARNLDLEPYGAYWGGEPAAKRLVGYLEPANLTIYAAEFPRQLVIDHRLRADVNGDIEILDMFWDPRRTRNAGDIVPPILAYADLLTTTDGRNIEAARMIYEQYVRPAFRDQA